MLKTFNITIAAEELEQIKQATNLLLNLQDAFKSGEDLQPIQVKTTLSNSEEEIELLKNILAALQKAAETVNNYIS
jgi:CHAD domain-containing protein